MKENIQEILREGKGRERGRKRRAWWDEKCRERKRGVRRRVRRRFEWQLRYSFREF